MSERISDYHEYALEELEGLITIKFDCKMYVNENYISVDPIANALNWHDVNKELQNNIALLDFESKTT